MKAAHLLSLLLLSLPLAAQQCNQQPGLADAHVLGLSFQPGFCETHGYTQGKAECLHLAKSSREAQHLSLHGLWPNQKSCGEHYGFCETKPLNHHCDYAPLAFNESTKTALKTIMPSFAYGTCLERHEWSKHGSCQLLKVDDFFMLSIQLAKAVTKTPLDTFIQQHRGETVAKTDLHAKVRESFGVNNVRKVFFGCVQGLLVDVYIQLPALLPAEASLASLVDEAPEFRKKDACPAKIKISGFYRE